MQTHVSIQADYYVMFKLKFTYLKWNFAQNSWHKYNSKKTANIGIPSFGITSVYLATFHDIITTSAIPTFECRVRDIANALPKHRYSERRFIDIITLRHNIRIPSVRSLRSSPLLATHQYSDFQVQVAKNYKRVASTSASGTQRV